jgi:hypothetical protein
MEQLCKYINIFLSGNLYNLPREQLNEQSGLLFLQQRLRGFRRLASFFAFAFYMAFPPIVLIFLLSAFQIVIHPVLQSAISIFYVIWIVLGIFLFVEKLSPDAKSFLIDLIKIIARRK